MGEPQKLTSQTPIRNKVRDASTVEMQVLFRLSTIMHSSYVVTGFVQHLP
jgi:hypothetical protein